MLRTLAHMDPQTRAFLRGTAELLENSRRIVDVIHRLTGGRAAALLTDAEQMQAIHAAHGELGVYQFFAGERLDGDSADLRRSMDEAVSAFEDIDQLCVAHKRMAGHSQRPPANDLERVEWLATTAERALCTVFALHGDTVTPSARRLRQGDPRPKRINVSPGERTVPDARTPWAILEITIEADGTVSSAEVIASVPGQDDFATRTVRAWLFEPQFVRGIPHRVVTVVGVIVNAAGKTD